MPDCKNYKLN